MRVLLQGQLIAGSGDAVGAMRHQRIIGVQRDVDRAVAALVDEVEAVIEELAKERHPGIERGRKAFVRCDVRDRDRGTVVLDAIPVQHGVKRRVGRSGLVPGVGVVQHRAQGRKRVLDGFERAARTIDFTREIAVEFRVRQRRDDGRGIVERHVRHEIRNQARICIGDAAANAVVVVGDNWPTRRAERHFIAIRFVAVVGRQ